MTKATVKVNISSYVKYWEKAVKQSMKQMEYVPLDVPWRKLWERDYAEYPMVNTKEYWSVMQAFSPWNEIRGIDFLSKSRINGSAQVVMSVELYALTRQLAEKYDEENGNEL